MRMVLVLDVGDGYNDDWNIDCLEVYGGRVDVVGAWVDATSRAWDRIVSAVLLTAPIMTLVLLVGVLVALGSSCDVEVEVGWMTSSLWCQGREDSSSWGWTAGCVLVAATAAAAEGIVVGCCCC